jgi:hypothetical protein
MVLRIPMAPRFGGREISQQSKWPAMYKWNFSIFHGLEIRQISANFG